MFESNLTKIINTLSKKSRKRLRKDYKEWIKEKGCLVSGMSGVDPHHIRNLNGLTGMSITPPDEFCIPLSRFYHSELHSPEVNSNFEIKYNINLINELKRLNNEFVETMKNYE